MRKMPSLKVFVGAVTGILIGVGLHSAPAAAAPAGGFVPGLWVWRSISHGPLGQVSSEDQELCLESLQGAIAAGDTATGSSGRDRANTVIHQHAHETTVIGTVVMTGPEGVASLRQILHFTTSGTRHAATMTGHGFLRSPAEPAMSITTRIHGHWLQATCPSQLPEAKRTTLKPPSLPGVSGQALPTAASPPPMPSPQARMAMYNQMMKKIQQDAKSLPPQDAQRVLSNLPIPLPASAASASAGR